MRKIYNIVIGIALYFICAIILMGYGHTETHPYLNEIIVLKFLDKLSKKTFTDKGNEKLKNYEFNWNNLQQPKLTGPAIHDDYYLSYTSADEVDDNFTPMKWISEGGWMEDEPWGPASICHFYDPLGIDRGFTSLTDCSGIIEAYPGLYNIKEAYTRDAQSWASDNPRHVYNWKVGKENIVKALKEPNQTIRDRYMAIAYRCLGQVLHLVCDMGCTPHVRNDSHPPNFYVPVGLGVVDLKFWKAIGDPDPYEDITKMIDVYTIWQENEPNKIFVRSISTLEKFETIFDLMARFTNENFFSGQTIYTDRYKPVIRPNNPYPNPKMTDENYNFEDHTYYADYDGVKVKMCKDLVATPLPTWLITGKDSTRGRPYLDYECVKSIATAIYPNLAEAGANVIKLFIPSLKIDIQEAKSDSGGIIRGKVYYTIPSFEDEYSGLFDLTNTYNGPVSLFINGKDTKITTTATQNKFEFKLDGKGVNVNIGDLTSAKIDFGGILLKSDEKEIEESNVINENVLLLNKMKWLKVTFTGTHQFQKSAILGGYVYHENVSLQIPERYSQHDMGDKALTWNGTNFTASFSRKSEAYPNDSWKIEFSGKVSADGTKVESLKATEKIVQIQGPESVLTWDKSFDIRNIGGYSYNAYAMDGPTIMFYRDDANMKNDITIKNNYTNENYMNTDWSQYAIFSITFKQ